MKYLSSTLSYKSVCLVSVYTVVAIGGDSELTIRPFLVAVLAVKDSTRSIVLVLN